jgi:hypothetical protein
MLSFTGIKSLRAWIRSDHGKDVVDEIRSDIIHENRGKDRVTVLMYGDGWVEVYASDTVDVCLMQVPEGATDEVVMELLPRPYQDMVDNDTLVGPRLKRSGQCERVSIGDCFLRALELELVSECLGKEFKATGRSLGLVK